LTDAYYPGWQASLNGRPVDILPVDILFRAVPVPAGEHTLVYEFKPRSVYLGAGISGLALLALVVGLVVTFRKQLAFLLYLIVQVLSMICTLA
jgi:uncharacterized membrane protein YfhO